MAKYEVYATRWDDPHIIEELIPARGLEFSMPLNDHGEASFSATVEPGQSFWRPSITPVASGILIARDDVPWWQGAVWSERQTGPRTFDFQCAEWGSFFERVPAVPHTYTGQDFHAVFRDLISRAALIPGQDPLIVLDPTTIGSAAPTLSIASWEDISVEQAFRQLGDAQGGPAWYFGTAGTMSNPQRTLVLLNDSWLDMLQAQAVLEYVETTARYELPGPPPMMTLLGNLFPGAQPQAIVGDEGGNVIAQPSRVRDGSQAATATIAIGSGQEAAQVRKGAEASTLLGFGYPRLTSTSSYTDVTDSTALQLHANADLASRAGLVTGYTLTTLDGEPDWTQVPRGSMVQVSLETDAFTGSREVVEFQARLLDVSVQVGDDLTQVNWTVAQVMESA